MNGKYRKVMASLYILSILLFTVISTIPTTKSQFQPNPQGLDISISNITFSDPEPKEDDEINITITVRNNESFPIPGLSILVFNYNQEIGNITNKTVDPNSISTYTIPWKAEGGTQNISAIISYDGNQLINTRYSKEIYVEPKPMGDIYFPIMVLMLILAVVFSAIIGPSIKAKI